MGWDEEKSVYHAGSNFPSAEAFNEAATIFLERKAKFELGCDQLSSTRLGGQHAEGANQARWNWGVEGCNQRGTYVTDCFSNWGDITCNVYTDSLTQGATTPPPAEATPPPAGSGGPPPPPGG